MQVTFFRCLPPLLEKITIQKNIKVLNDNTFIGCDNLKEIIKKYYLESEVTQKNCIYSFIILFTKFSIILLLIFIKVT